MLCEPSHQQERDRYLIQDQICSKSCLHGCLQRENRGDSVPGNCLHFDENNFACRVFLVIMLHLMEYFALNKGSYCWNNLKQQCEDKQEVPWKWDSWLQFHTSDWGWNSTRTVTEVKWSPRNTEHKYRGAQTHLYARVMHSKSLVNEASMERCDMLALPKW